MKYKWEHAVLEIMRRGRVEKSGKLMNQGINVRANGSCRSDYEADKGPTYSKTNEEKKMRLQNEWTKTRRQVCDI